MGGETLANVFTMSGSIKCFFHTNDEIFNLNLWTPKSLLLTLQISLGSYLIQPSINAWFHVFTVQ